MHEKCSEKHYANNFEIKYKSADLGLNLHYHHVSKKNVGFAMFYIVYCNQIVTLNVEDLHYS